ncbi:Vacuolar cation-chloride cotransporter 1 [Cladobotryum mycophilum]|uniref:Vacuolar cation-chloride cotransporter 1 n=1 Tax=Cladobotryum mycophilum TaxID=491253 RepID=A0ABR0SNG6_9HYPO
MPSQSPERKGSVLLAMESRRAGGGSKLGTMSGVYVPVYLNILSILMFLRFGHILGQVGFLGILSLLVVAYCIDLLTTLSLSAIASNGEVKGGGAYYLISRSLGPEFGGSIGILFFLAQALNTALNVVGLIDCVRLNLGSSFPEGYWTTYGLQTMALMLCTGLCLLGSATFAKASNGLLIVLTVAIISVPISAIFKSPFRDESTGIDFTGISVDTLVSNFLPHTTSSSYRGMETFRDLFGILFPATSGIFAGASMSGDLRDPSKSIPVGTLWATLTTFIIYFVVIISLAASTTHESLLANNNVISLTSLYAPLILAGECAVTFFSALMGIIGSAKLFQALARDDLLPGLSIFSRGTKKGDEPIFAIFLTYAIAQVALLADLNQIATLISMGYQMTFFVMNLACFLLKIGSAPNFRPGFQLFSAQTACIGSLLSATAMFFIDETYASTAISALILLFLLIHYLSPPKHWGDVSQNLIYHQVRKYLLRLKPEHIKFWRPHIILLTNNPRRQTRLIQFCNSLKKGSLYILGHVIVTDDFNAGVHEAKLQQQAWTRYISEFSRIKAFVQLTMSPSITWGVRNMILSAGLGGMRPNIAVLGFYNMDELRRSNSSLKIPDIPMSPAAKMNRPPKSQGKAPRRRRSDSSARLLEGVLPTDFIRTENMMSPAEYMTILEDLALRYRLNVAVAHGFQNLETPREDGSNTKKYIDLWPIQMSAEVSADGKSMLTSNFDTYTLILQLGHILRSVHTWKRVFSLRVMVFVEYESEVEEEGARVRALLEKLRIDAEIRVFWLACGQLNTYELIINGKSNDMDCEIVVNDALRDEEWWCDLQTVRGRLENMSSSQELTHMTHILDSTAGRPGVYNPHGEMGSQRRRSSVADFAGMPKRPNIGTLSKLGINVGIHTNHLNDDVFEDTTSDSDADSIMYSTDRDEAPGPVLSTLTEEVEPSDATQRPLLPRTKRRRSQGHIKKDSEGSSSDKDRSTKPSARRNSFMQSYGTMTDDDQTTPTGPASLQIPESSSRKLKPRTSVSSFTVDHKSIESFPNLDMLPLPDHFQNAPRLARAESPTRSPGDLTPANGASTPVRPTMSRQASAARFSSRPVPETKVIVEEGASKLGFAPTNSTPATPKAERPSLSRHSSYNNKMSSRPAFETKVNDGEEASKSIAFAEQPAFRTHSASNSRRHSRQGSQFSNIGVGDASLNITELLKSYKLDAQAVDEGGSPYSTQGVALSFNDLPSRAQHLIINELMKQNSKDTAVLMSTLPIPSEGTCSDQEATIQYLSDVEILCHDLPPTLMVLSNNMTVTVSL